MSPYRELLIQLQSLLSSGVPVKEALASIAEEGSSKPLAAVVLDAVESGKTLGEAMREQPAVPTVHAALICAGEESGKLVEILTGIITDLDKMLDAKRSLMRQAVYPVAVFGLVLLLPPVSLYVFTGDVMPGLSLNLAILLVLGSIALILAKGPGLFPRGAFRLAAERAFFAIPGLRSLVRDRVVGRVLSLEGLLLEAGLGLDDSLALVKEAVGWQTVENEVDEVARDIREGHTAGESFRRLSRLESTAITRLANAEKAGRLGAGLKQVGEEMRQRFIHRLQVTFAVLPVFIYLAAALFILSRALSVFGDLSGALDELDDL